MDAPHPAITPLLGDEFVGHRRIEIPVQHAALLYAISLVRANIATIREPAPAPPAVLPTGAPVYTYSPPNFDWMLQSLSSLEILAGLHFYQLSTIAAGAGHQLPPANDATFPQALKALSEAVPSATGHYQQLTQMVGNVTVYHAATEDILAIIRLEREGADEERRARVYDAIVHNTNAYLT